jgi:hypothetical protein
MQKLQEITNCLKPGDFYKFKDTHPYKNFLVEKEDMYGYKKT